MRALMDTPEMKYAVGDYVNRWGSSTNLVYMWFYSHIGP